MVNDYDLSSAFKAIEDELIASMMRNMKNHRAEEDEQGIEWSMWQTEQLKALEKYRKDNQKRYNGEFSRLNKQIEGLIRKAKETGGLEQEIRILQAIRRGFKGLGRNGSPAHQTLSAQFFRLNERKLNALIEATTHDMQKAETAVLRMANDQYRKIIYNTQVYANSGAGTYEKAVDMATKDFLSAGLNCIEYKNGARHTLADYADMAIRTASKRAYLQGEGEKRQEWGISTAILNKRGNPCPRCAPFIGKVLIDDVWSGGKRSDGKYPLLSSAIRAGLYHPRCKDSHTTYFPGISTAGDSWTKEELKKVGAGYLIEQKQKYAQRQAERFGRLEEYSLDSENKRWYGARVEQWKEKADEYFLGKYRSDVSGNISFEDATDEWKAVFQEQVKDVENIANSATLKLDNIQVRKRYLERVSAIKDSIDPELPIEEKAKKAFEMRNQIRTEAREMMADEEARKRLDRERPNKTFEELIQSKMARKGITREEAIQDVYNTATKTNVDVNKELGLDRR